MTSAREARLKPEYTHLYPGLEPGVWYRAAWLSARQFARQPNRHPFSEQARQGTGVRAGLRRVGVLVESGQRGGITTGEAEGTIHHDPLDIAEMAHYLLHAPLARAIAKSAAGFRNPGQAAGRLLQLPRQLIEDVG